MEMMFLAYIGNRDYIKDTIIFIVISCFVFFLNECILCLITFYWILTAVMRNRISQLNYAFSDDLARRVGELVAGV